MNTHKPILLSSNITYWKSKIFLVKVQSALSWHAPPAWGEEEVKKFRKAFAGEGEGGKSENWSGNFVCVCGGGGGGGGLHNFEGKIKIG